MSRVCLSLAVVVAALIVGQTVFTVQHGLS